MLTGSDSDSVAPDRSAGPGRHTARARCPLRPRGPESPPSLHRKPADECRRRERKRRLHHRQRKQCGTTRKTGHRPDKNSCARADLHRERRAKPAAQTVTQRLREDSAGHGFQEKADGQGRYDLFVHGKTRMLIHSGQ